MAAEELERANLERARARAALPYEVRDQINDDNPHRMAEGRAVLTQEERNEINQANAERMAGVRAKLTHEERDEVNALCNFGD